MEEPELKKVEKELSGVKRQLAKVEANTRAVDAAIAGQGTYRGYSGEDCFLKDNLRVVQKEMLKQLRRKERGLDRLRRELMARVGVPTAGRFRLTTYPVGFDWPMGDNSTRDAASEARFETEFITEGWAVAKSFYSGLAICLAACSKIDLPYCGMSSGCTKCHKITA